jgi:hypothetical protein
MTRKPVTGAAKTSGAKVTSARRAGARTGSSPAKPAAAKQPSAACDHPVASRTPLGKGKFRCRLCESTGDY